MRGTFSARIPQSRSGNWVVAARSTAAWTDRYDRTAMERNRHKPASLTAHDVPGKERICPSSMSPGRAKTVVSAASRKGRARAVRFWTSPNPTREVKIAARISASSNPKVSQARSGVSAAVRIKSTVSTSLTRGSNR